MKLAKLLVFLLSYSCFFMVYSNPVFQNVKAGTASVSQTPGTTTVNQGSQRVILNWKKFNINVGEKTTFNQPTGGVALNRIDATQGVSQIYGHLTATGQIILINASGIYFGPTAHVNVGGMIASTSDISDDNFLNGNYVFDKPSTLGGSITNDGKIIASQHGLVALLGNNVTNNGDIEAELGSIVLASGNKFTLSFSGDQLINFSIDEGTGRRSKVTNTGSLTANGGKIIVSARTASSVLDNTINMSGVTQANSVALQNGEIIFSADSGKINVNGAVIANGNPVGGTGGNIKILGQKIDVANAYLTASGDTGGSIYLGGYETIAGTKVNAKSISLAACSQLIADGVTGTGGNVTLAADNLWLSGNVFARSLSNTGGTINAYGKQIDIDGAYFSVASKKDGGMIRIGTNPFGDGTTSNIDTSLFSALDASSYGPGNGGNIAFNANTINLHGIALANAKTTGGSGGSINLSGNNITLDYFSILAAMGDLNGGSISISPLSSTTSHVTTRAFSLMDVSSLGIDSGAGSINVGLANTTSLGGYLLSVGKGSNSFGGSIRIAGKSISIEPSARIDASGDGFGGRIIIGTNPLISSTPSADLITVKAGSEIKAMATGIADIGLGAGSITIFGKDTIFNGKALANASATASSGGRISVLATNRVQLGATSVLDVSGDMQGGLVNVGGSLNGSGIEPNALFTTMERGSTINASALRNGNGGTVVLWADDTTDFNGDIKARGGSESGDGGFVQVVGVNQLINNGTVDVSAPNGNPGTVDNTP